MGFPGSELENMRRYPEEIVRRFIRGMCVLGGETAQDMRDELVVVENGWPKPGYTDPTLHRSRPKAGSTSSNLG